MWLLLLAAAARSARSCDFFASRPEYGVAAGREVGGATLAACLGAGDEAEAWLADSGRGPVVVKIAKRDVAPARGGGPAALAFWHSCDIARALTRRSEEYFTDCYGFGLLRGTHAQAAAVPPELLESEAWGVPYIVLRKAEGDDMLAHLLFLNGGLAAPSVSFLPTVESAVDFVLRITKVADALLQPDAEGYVVVNGDMHPENLLVTADGAHITMIDYSDVLVCCMPGQGRPCEQHRRSGPVWPTWEQTRQQLLEAGGSAVVAALEGPRVPLCRFDGAEDLDPAERRVRKARMFMGAELSRYLTGSVTLPGGLFAAEVAAAHAPPADLAAVAGDVNAQLEQAGLPWRVGQPLAMPPEFAPAAALVAKYGADLAVGGWDAKLRQLLADASGDPARMADADAAVLRWCAAHWRAGYRNELQSWPRERPALFELFAQALRAAQRTDTRALTFSMGRLAGVAPPWGYAPAAAYDFAWPPPYAAPLRQLLLAGRGRGIVRRNTSVQVERDGSLPAGSAEARRAPPEGSAAVVVDVAA